MHGKLAIALSLGQFALGLGARHNSRSLDLKCSSLMNQSRFLAIECKHQTHPTIIDYLNICSII